MVNTVGMLRLVMHGRTLFAAITILFLLSASVTIVQAGEPIPDVDTAQRDDVVEEEGGPSGTVDLGIEKRLPDVDTAQRDDVVPEDDDGGASGAVDEGSEARLPDVDTAERDDVVPEDDGGGASGAVDEGSGARLPDVDTAERDDVVPEDDGGGASGAVDEGSGARLPDVDTAERDDVVPEDDEGGATGSAATAPAPTGLRVTSDTDDSVSLSWNAVTDAGAYKVEYRRSSSSTWLHANYVYSRTTETVDGLDCNTSYYFRVRARGDGSPYSFTYGTASSSASETTDGCPLPTAPRPTGLRVTSDTDDSVSLSWNAVTDAGAYKVEYRRSSSSSWLHAGYVFSGTTETVDGLNCDTSYYFRVRARGDGSPYSFTYGTASSSASETTDGCPLPTAPRPTGLRVTSDTDDSVSLSWSAVTNAAVYKVEYRRSGSSSWLHASYVYSGTTETVDGLDCDTSYYFRVRARGDGSPYSTSYGDASSSVLETTDGCTAPAPTGLRATSDTDDSVSLSWSAVTNSAVYKVEYRRSGSSSWLHASYVYSGTTETVDGLDCDTSYYFRVRARGDGSPYSTSYGDASSSVSETTDGCTAPAPTGLRVTSDTDDSVSLSWSAVTNAAVYKVEYRRSGSISWLHASYVYSGTTETVDGLDCDTSYYFRVRARGDGSPYSTSYGDASSSVSETTDGCTVAPAPTGLSATASAQTSVTLSWNPVTDAQYYRLERSTSRTGPWTGISSTIVGTSRTVYGLECNTLYYFKVSARGDGHPYSTTFGQQSSGDVSRRTTECPGAPAPIGLEVTASTDTTVTLEWFWVRDAQHYKLERRLDGSTSWTLADAGADSITTNSYTVTGLACNTTYRFRVSAHGDGHPYSNSFGSPSPSSNPRTTSACRQTFIPNPLGLGDTSNVWTVPTGTTSVYVDVDFSTGYVKDTGSGYININRVNSFGTTLSTKAIDRESDRGVVTGVVAGSLIRIDVDKDAFDSGAALVTLTFHSGSDATGREIARATVQKESRPYMPVAPSSGTPWSVDETVGSVTLSWGPGAARVGSNADHYEVVIPDTSNPSTPLYSDRNIDDSSNPATLTISNARALGLEGTHTAEVYHCNSAGGCSLPLSITFTITPSIALLGVGASLEVDASDQFSVSVRKLNPSHNYRIRVVYTTSHIAENSGCPGGSTNTIRSFSGSTTFYVGRFNVYGCSAGTSTITASLHRVISGVEQAPPLANAVATVSVITPNPPASPTDLNGGVADKGVRLGWTAPSGVVTGYRVQRRVDAAGTSFSTIATLSRNDATYTDGDTALVEGMSYLYRVIAFNSGGDSPSPSHVSVSFKIILSEWNVLAYKYILIDWTIPEYQRLANHQFRFGLLMPAGSDTGFQINPATAPNAKQCNWSSPPSNYTSWSNLGTAFYLVRCKLGTGTGSIEVQRRPDSGTPRPITSILTWGPIVQSWHRADHQVGYLIDSSSIDGVRPVHLPVTYTPDETASSAAINGAALTWNGAQSYVTFDAVSTSPDTTIRGYWNPRGTNQDDKCTGSIACVYGGGTYPELGDQKFWIEYPPQFPGDASYKEWTNDPDEARRQPDDFYYLPQVIMHEFGHTAGLGHTPGGNVMGAIDSRNPIEAPTPYDVDGMRNNYESHTRHEDGVQ